MNLKVGSGWPLNNTIPSPGLTTGAQEINRLVEELPKRFAVFSYKQQMACLWVVFLGGTGTGKSTLFNSFCGKPLSETGVERPKTAGPVVYAHRDCPIEKGFPFPFIEIERYGSENFKSPSATGSPGHLLILEHDRGDFSHLVLVDTPDLDSVEAENRQIAADLYMISDAVVFVTSQEKYADDVPYQFLLRIMGEGRPYFYLLNKAQERLTEEDVTGALKGQGISFGKDRIWLIPYAPSHPSQWISEQAEFRDFGHVLSRELSPDVIDNLRETAHSKGAADLRLRLGRLLELLEQENRAARKWVSRLEDLFQKTSQGFINEQKDHFESKSREYLGTEIRKLFSRYDVLAKPRWLIKEVFLRSLRLLGFRKEDTLQNHKESLKKARQKIDLVPVQMAIERFNRSVLENLSPPDKTSPLFIKLRQPDVVLEEGEINERFWEEQDRLDVWLEERFQRLSQELPRSKKWGIYSTSILWGILIISLETAIGGGFTILDAALGSALAPFVTEGAIELVAYHDTQTIARELAKRYEEGLLSLVRDQRDRYENSLQSLMICREDVENLQSLHSGFANKSFPPAEKWRG